MKNLCFLSANALHAHLVKKDFSCTELTRAILARIEEGERKLGCYITVTAEAALDAAKRVDKKLEQGEELSFLEGIPTAVKDNICTKGIKTTCASRMLESFVPPYDATAVSLLKHAGAVILGKTNMDEFGMGSSSEHSCFGSTKNPLDLDRVPGGSSGGSAAALAAGEATLALGSDTGGSVRQPAAFCGVVGLKPTYGRISRYGLIPFASSFDQIGPMARTVSDCAALFDVLAKHDPKDSTSVSCPDNEPLSSACAKGVLDLTVGLPTELLTSPIQPDVQSAVSAAAAALTEMGATVRECSLLHLSQALPCYYIISSAEAASNLGRYDGVSYGFRAPSASSLDELYFKSRSLGFGNEVKRRIMLGTFALSAGHYDGYYKRAQAARAQIKEDFLRVFSSVDLLLMPTAPTTAWRFGEMPAGSKTYAQDICTVAAGVTGLPAISLPFGKDSLGLPVGVQLMGAPFSESRLFAAAGALELAAKAAESSHKKGGEKS